MNTFGHFRVVKRDDNQKWESVPDTCSNGKKIDFIHDRVGFVWMSRFLFLNKNGSHDYLDTK